MAKNELGLTKLEEQIICASLHNVLDRLIASNKLVLELSKFEPKSFPELSELILKARRYVLTQMTSEVGVRKMAREKWGMILTKTS